MKARQRFAFFAAIVIYLLLAGCGGRGIASTPPLATPAHASSSTAWSFAVMADTQWTVADSDGRNPNTVAVDIINQLTRQFIQRGVKFVIQVGDLTDDGSIEAIDTRAVCTQALYNAGVGFFPLRGNHESSRAAAVEFLKMFPQTQNGVMNNTPHYDALSASVGFDVNQKPAAKFASALTIGSNFSSPAKPAGLTGLSYSFDYRNARFVLLEQFTRSDGTGDASSALSNTNIADQQSWITSTLAGKPSGGHAFVFAHKGLITENHVDSLLGADPSKNPANQNAFMASLEAASVGYFFCGHDHIHQRSMIASPDGASTVRQIIAASNSSKFYIPNTPSNDTAYNTAGPRETSIMQELYKIGFYIVTVDGSRVTVDYYSADNTAAVLVPALKECLIYATPILDFVKKETFGYSLNGKEFLVTQKGTYTAIRDIGPSGTTLRILSGANSSTATDGSGRRLTKAVSTGWQAATKDVSSDILNLRGMEQALGSGLTDTYTISISYTASGLDALIRNGGFGVVGKDADGNWVNAANRNYGGARKFVPGPWTPDCKLGAYGVDTTTQTAWAVINYNGDFAVGKF